MKLQPRKRIHSTGSPTVAHPIKLNKTGRYFIDQRGDPVFWLGATHWNLFRGYNIEDARSLIEKTKAKGFDFMQVKLLGGGDGRQSNIYGENPFTEFNPLTPNEAYFKRVDAVIQIARENNVAISMTVFHQRYREYITAQNAGAWAEWVAKSDCASREKDGDLGHFRRYLRLRYGDILSRAAFALEVGELSDVVETFWGFHLVQITGKTPAWMDWKESKRWIKHWLPGKPLDDAIAEALEKYPIVGVREPISQPATQPATAPARPRAGS